MAKKRGSGKAFSSICTAKRGTLWRYNQFRERCDHGVAEIFVMKNDGTEKTNISHGKICDLDPAWSPDGEWIAFSRHTEKYPRPLAVDIWIMRRDGTEQHQITRNKLYQSSYSASWSR